MVTECRFEGCTREVQAVTSRLCHSHYCQEWKGKPLTPLNKRLILPIDKKGRVCTGCMAYKTWENFYMRNTGKRQSKCKPCMIMRNTISNRGAPCAH